MTDVYQNGVIPAGGTVDVNIATMHLPASITITDIAGTRNIQLSFNGTNFYAPPVDVTDAAFITVALTAPARVMRLNGTVGAAWEIRSGN